jgi:hypothetical protein
LEGGFDTSHLTFLHRGDEANADGVKQNLPTRYEVMPFEFDFVSGTFETLATGSLLIQERCDDIDLFFVAGRHYLRFETLTDLFDIAALLRSNPERAEAVRREGTAFLAERYSDDKLIGYLDRFLFHRETAARSAA